jgi:hypothetical protein
MAGKKGTGDIRLANVSDDLEGGFDTILLNISRLDSLNIILTRESQNVKGILTSNRHQLAAVRPVDLLGLNLNSSDKTTSSPVEKGDTTLTCNTEKNTAMESLSLETNIETAGLLLKVLKDLDAHG